MLSGGKLSSNMYDSPKTTKPTINGSPISARTFKNSPKATSNVTPRVAWSMSPLMEVFPGSSPPPAGSSGSSLISHLSSNTCSPKSVRTLFLSDFPANASPKLKQLSMADIRSSPDHEDSDRDERSVDEEDSHLAQGEQSTNEDSGGESPIAARDKLMDRPKPYHEFLDEVKKQQLQAEVEAWKKTEKLRLMTKLRQEEAAIEEWEFKQTSKALKDIKKLEIQLEKQRTKAVEDTWKKINMTKEEAKRKKMRARQCTIGRLSEVSENSHKSFSYTKSVVLRKLTDHCKTLYFKSVRSKATMSSERQRSLR